MKKVNILNYGEGGSGKSSSIATLFKLLPKFPKLKVRYLMTEANAMDGLVDGLTRHKIELKPGQLHYMVARDSFKHRYTSRDSAKDFKENFLDKSEADALKVKISSGDRAKHDEFYSILVGMANFKGTDYVTKEVEDLGDYYKWDSDCILVVDSLTTCVDYLVSAVKGNRIATVQRDYMDVQTNLMSKIIVPITEKCECSVIVLGHPVLGEDQTVRQPKEEEQKILKLYPRTFGQALNNSIVSKFSETFYSYVDRQDKFWWAGKKDGVATSPRRLPREDKLVPDFSLYNIFED